MPAKVQSLKLFLEPGSYGCTVPLSSVIGKDSFILALKWNFKEQPMKASILEDKSTLEVNFLAPLQYPWFKRLLGIKPYIYLSVVDLVHGE